MNLQYDVSYIHPYIFRTVFLRLPMMKLNRLITINFAIQIFKSSRNPLGAIVNITITKPLKSLTCMNTGKTAKNIGTSSYSIMISPIRPYLQLRTEIVSSSQKSYRKYGSTVSRLSVMSLWRQLCIKLNILRKILKMEI